MRNGNRLRPTVELLEERLPLAGDTFLVNFAPEISAVPNRYLVDSGELFGVRDSGLSYGWSSDHTDVSRERGVEADQRLDTLVQFRAFQDWEFELAVGTYQVTVSVGDASTASNHTINVEGTNYWNNTFLAAGEYQALTNVVTVIDGRLTIDQGMAGENATRINYVHIQGLASGVNGSPSAPLITEPALDAGSLAPTDVHMEAIGYFDPESDPHLSSDWEIWTTGPGSERVWFTLGIQGVERLHTHLGDGFFENSQAGRTDLVANTGYELRVRFRDAAGSASEYATRGFSTGSAFTVFPLSVDDVLELPPPRWMTIGDMPVELPGTGAILSPADTVVAIDLDGGSSYPAAESPQNAVDGTLEKYLNFGQVNAGFIVTPASGASIVQSFQITTANDAEERDPTSWQLFGTNEMIVSGDNSVGNSEDWTLIDSGGVELPAARNTRGPTVAVNNMNAYSSYRMIITGIKNAASADSMQFAEVQFFGTLQAGPLLSPTNPVIAIDLDGGSSYPGDETPENAIDRTTAKYLNFGEVNSGLIVTPSNATSIVEAFQITTANDAVERDPSEWQLFGTNDAIVSTDNSRGNLESWTLIDSGNLNLPTARNALGSLVPVNNTTPFTSYRMIFADVKNAAAANSMQLSEIQFFGSQSGMPTPPSLKIETAGGELLLAIEGSEVGGNTVTNPPALAEHGDIRVILSGGSTGLQLSASDLTFFESQGQQRRICLPILSLAPGEELYLWVAVDGSTYYGEPSQTTPVFNLLARDCATNVPFIATQPNYVVDVVAEGFQLPVNVAFIPDPGPAPGDPAFYVTELYGTIKVVANDGTVSDFATDLLNFNPTGNFPGSGEQGLAGIVVDPATGDVYITRVTDTDGVEGGAHHPQVVRFTSTDGGRTAASETVILNMVGESQGQSHQISNISIGPDNKLYVHNGDGFDASTGLNLDSYRGKVLRVNFDGTAPSDNPFYNAANGINSRDYIFAYGFRNPFGGAWRASDGVHYQVENGPSVDRFSKVEEGVSYGWDGSNASMFTNALYNWNPAHAPVNLTFVQPETFNGSQFPTEKWDRVFVGESGPTYANGPQSLGKRIVEFELDAGGNVVGGPTTLVEYAGTGRATVVGLAAGPDGLYFTELYRDEGAASPIDAGARVLRVRYVPPTPTGDFDQNGVWDCTDIDALVAESAAQTNAAIFDMTGDGLVNTEDVDAWLLVAGTENPTVTGGNPFLLGDANLDGAVDVSDFNSWNSNKFQTSRGWCGGDFSADGVVDVSDFNIWNANKFSASSDAVLGWRPSVGQAKSSLREVAANRQPLADPFDAPDTPKTNRSLLEIPTTVRTVTRSFSRGTVDVAVARRDVGAATTAEFELSPFDF